VHDVFDNATVIARRGAGRYDVYLGGFSPGGVDPISTIHLATWDPRNYSGYSNPRLDLVLANGLKASDPKARATLYRVAQQIILADRPYIAFYNPNTLAASSTNVSGVGLTPTGLLTVAHAQLS
jgi:ABC-type transport system substrate-binding protein